MEMLIESFWLYIVVGLIAEAILATALVQTGRGVFLWAMLGVAVLAVGGALLEVLIETDKEKVENTLYGAADALCTNVPERVFEYIGPQAENVRRDAEFALERIEVTDATFANLKIEFNQMTSPPKAMAQFEGIIRFEDRREVFPYQFYKAPVTVELRKHGDRWLIVGHDFTRP